MTAWSLGHANEIIWRQKHKQSHVASKNTNGSKNILAKCLDTTIFEK